MEDSRFKIADIGSKQISVIFYQQDFVLCDDNCTEKAPIESIP
jgi:hypothetical protein